MNKINDNKLAISVVATLTAGIALIYVLIAYPRLIFAVFGTSVIFLICAYILTQNIVAFINIKNKSLNVQIKSGMDDISSQIEGMSSAQAQLGKATYLYTRQTAENVATLRGNYTDSQEVLHKNLSVLANAQNKSTKLLIKYDQNNTTKLISTLKDIKNHLNETVSQGFEQMPQANNDDVVAMLQSIVDYLKSQPANMDQSLSMQINNVAHELQNISMSIAKVQSVPMQPVMPMQQMNMPPVYQAAPAPQATPDVNDTIETPVSPEVPETEAAEAVIEAPEITDIQAQTEVPEPMDTQAEAETPEPVDIQTEAETPEPVDTQAEAEIPEPVNIQTEAEIPEPVDIQTEVETSEPEATINESETAETSEFTPTFTVVGKSDEEVNEDSSEPEAEPKPAPAPEPVEVAPVSDDPNKQLSADEIAALFAAAEPAPKKEEPAPAPEPVAVTPVSDDPNKQLSADEIAALFASIG